MSETPENNVITPVEVVSDRQMIEAVLIRVDSIEKTINAIASQMQAVYDMVAENVGPIVEMATKGPLARLLGGR